MACRTVDPRFGTRMRELLAERGLSYRALAARTYHAKSHLHALATGVKAPTVETAQRIDDALGAGGELTGYVHTNNGPDSLMLAQQHQTYHTWSSMRRGMNTVTAADVAAARELTQVFRSLDNRFGGGHTHSAAAHYLDHIVLSMVHEGRYSEAIGQELFSAAAQLAHLVAWTAYDLQEHQRAQLYFARAAELALVASDHAFCGEILAARSHQAIHLGYLTEAVALARASQRAASKASGSPLLAEAHELEANGLALLGDTKGAMSSLQRSEHAFRRANIADTPEWLQYFDANYLTVRFAHCFRDLKDWHRAQDYALQAVEATANLTRMAVFNKALLATAYIETDLEEACSVALDAARSTQMVQSGRARHYVRDFRRRLHERHGEHPHVQAFMEQTAVLIGSA